MLLSGPVMAPDPTVASATCRARRSPTRGYQSRAHAGAFLAELCAPVLAEGALVVGVGAGGVAVARGLAPDEAEVVVAGVAPIAAPWSAELCLGALTFDGSIHFDERLLAEVGLSPRQLEPQVEAARTRLATDEAIAEAPRPHRAVHRSALLVCDGLQRCTELEAVVAATAALGYRPLALALATAHWRDLRRLGERVARLYCADVHRHLGYRPADAYASEPDPSERSRGRAGCLHHPSRTSRGVGLA